MRDSEQGSRLFSYEAERRYYSAWPIKPQPYLHLERYLRCWLDPEEVFTGKRVLDIGAGEMTYTRLIADRFEPKEIVACELFSERMLPAYRDNGNPRLKSVTGSCFQLPFKNISFDVAFASGVLSQLPNLKEALIEIGRVLRPGGLFVGWDPNPFNVVILYRYMLTPRSPNQFMFWPHKVLPVFHSAGFSTNTRFFYARIPWTRSRFLSTCVGMVARKFDHG